MRYEKGTEYSKSDSENREGTRRGEATEREREREREREKQAKKKGGGIGRAQRIINTCHRGGMKTRRRHHKGERKGEEQSRQRVPEAIDRGAIEGERMSKVRM